MGSTSDHLQAIAGQAGHLGVGSRYIVEPPCTQDDDPEDSDLDNLDDEKPLNRENLQSRVLKALAKKGDSAIRVRPVQSEQKKGKK